MPDTRFRATYRLQLQKSFRLNDAASLTAYLGELGVSHLYLSPILESRPGSQHGYDAIDPTRVSEERGGDEGFERLAAKLAGKPGLEGLILDIVPNHVAATWRNPAWWDVLLKGQASRYWTTFDFRPRGRDSRIVLPVLGRSRQACLAARELHFDFVPQRGLVIRYWDHLFPVAEKSYSTVLNSLAAHLSERSARAQQWRNQILLITRKKSSEKSDGPMIRALNAWLDADSVAERVLRLTLRTLPLKVLERVLEEQFYRLEDWRSGNREVNYRRFFDINDLAAVRMEDPKTFKWAHSKVGELIHKYPIIHGLRVDHIDGLTDPENYLKQLRKLSPHVWVEKILGENETVPPNWPITGTTGYEFLGMSARLFVDLPGLLHLHSHYTRHIDRRWERFHECVYDSKREMLESHFVSEFELLSDQFYALAARGRRGPAFSREDLFDALKELTSSLRVYRTYFASGGRDTDTKWLAQAFSEVEGRGRVPATGALAWLRSVLLEHGDWSEATYQMIKKWEQLTGPVMAKGLEDTALYRYFPLLSLNVVGGEPDWVGDGAIEFHAFNQERLRRQPLTMSTTSTHDTKRSEDVRARIHVISEISEEWTKLFEVWHRQNAKLRRLQPRPIPDVSTEYLIYETLVGAWPHDGKITGEFVERMKQYFLKAARESKSETSWIEPDAGYESALMEFADRLLALPAGSEFMKSFREFAEKCSYFGAFNSLSTLTLKALSPGLPDFYQGEELWDLSLVDPDNRRPIDYERRRTLLQGLKKALREEPKDCRERLLRDWKSGEVKLWLTWQLLQLKKKDPELFVKGEYLSIEPLGEGRRHFVCFMRRFEGRSILVVVPRFLASTGAGVGRKLAVTDLRALNTEIQLPHQAARVWRCVLTGRKIESRDGEKTLLASDVLDGLPVGIAMA